MQSYLLSFELNELPPSLNVFMRWHYRKRASEFKRIENNCRKLILGKAPKAPLASYQIIFTRFTIRPLDIDNLVASFKPILDSLVRSGVIEDDKWEMSEFIRYKQVKVKTKLEQKISITVLGSVGMDTRLSTERMGIETPWDRHLNNPDIKSL